MKTKIQSAQNFLKKHWLILLILLGALAVRLWHLNHGLPYLYFEDEEFFTGPALRVAGLEHGISSLNPEWFGAPGQTLIYGTAFVFRCVYTWLQLTQHVTGSLQDVYIQHINVFQTAARGISVLAGVGMVWWAYMIGALQNRRTGYWAAAAIGSSFYLTYFSHIIRPDILQTFFLLGVVYALLRIIREPQAKYKWYILLGVMLGAAATTKFPSAFVTPVIGIIAATHLYQYHKHFNWRGWITAAASGALTVFITAPFMIWHFQAMLEDVRAESTNMYTGHNGLSFLGNLWWYITSVLPWEVGTGLIILLGLFIIALIIPQTRGLILTTTRATNKTYFVADFAIILAAATSYLLFLSRLQLHWERWLIPVSTLLLIATGYALAAVQSSLRGNTKQKLIFIIIIILCFAAPLTRLTRTLTALAQPNTQDVAREWINKNAPNNSTIIREPYTPEISAHPTPKDRVRETNTFTAANGNQYTVTLVPNAVTKSLSSYKKNSVDYILLGAVFNRIYEEAALPNPQPNFTEARAQYNELLRNSVLTFSANNHPRYTLEQLLYAPDWEILRIPALTFSFGDPVYIEKFIGNTSGE